MKFVTKRIAVRVAGALLLAAVGQTMFSCSKQQDSDQLNTSPTKLSIKVSGINELKSNSEKKSSARKSSLQNSKEANLLSFDEFDVQAVVDDKVETRAKRETIRNKTNKTSSSSAKAAVLETGVKYRLFLYKGSTLISSNELEVDPSIVTTIDVVPGETYNWYALSYNSEVNVPDVDPADPKIDLAGGNDVLYATGSIEIPTAGASEPLAIVFDHKVSQIAVELNSMGMFGKFAATGNVTVTGLNVQTGSFNVLTGEWSNLAPYSQSIAWSNFQNIDANGDRKVFVTYTASPAPLTDVKLGISNFSIDHVDGVTRNFTTGGEFEFDVTPVIGESHRLLANLVESPLTVTKGSTTARWARSNLYYENAHNPYRFYAINEATGASDGRGYFSFGGIIPRKFATDGKKDPCALVYPEGVWRQPTNVEFGTLTTSDGLLTNVLGNVLQLLVSAPAKNYDNSNATGDGTYIEYKVNAGSGNTAFGTTSNALRFYYNGQVTNVSVISDIGADGLVLLNLGGSRGVETALWTNDGGLDVPILGLSAGAWGYHARNKRTLAGVNFIGAQGTAELLSNVDLLGLNAISSTFKNVRCVRK